MAQHKRKLDINGYKYRSDGICENPTTFLQFDSSTYYYELYISECHAGWLIGWTFGNKKGGGSSNWPSIKNGIHPTRTGAEISVAEECATYFKKDLGSSAFAALKKFLHTSGSTILTDTSTNTNNTDMAKATGGAPKKDAKKVPDKKPPASKKTKIITLPQGIGKKVTEPKTLGSADRGPGEMVFVMVNLKDGFCNYNFKLEGGKADGFVHKVTGKGIIDADFRNAFQLLNVHLAIRDDVFKHNSIEITNFNLMHAHELTHNYHVTGFSISGGEENLSVIIIGNKYLSGGDRMELKTPKTSLDNLSSYKWFEELKAAITRCQEETQEYHDGKYTLPVKKEKKDKDKTGNLFEGQDDEEDDHFGSDEDQEEETD